MTIIFDDKRCGQSRSQNADVICITKHDLWDDCSKEEVELRDSIMVTASSMMRVQTIIEVDFHGSASVNRRSCRRLLVFWVMLWQPSPARRGGDSRAAGRQ